MTEEIRAALFQLQDKAYRDFQIRLLPTVASETVIGVRTPELRKLARELGKKEGVGAFLNELPHGYFDENQLHAFLISEIRDYAACLDAVDRFLPFVDNWATCDQLSPKTFKKHKRELIESVKGWIVSKAPYTARFGVGMLMEHYLDEAFDPAYLRLAADIRSEEYYVRMMVAWYFATALAKQYAAALPFIEQRRLDPWTHNKTIQKAVESDRISPEKKEFLRGMKIKAPK